MSERVKLNLASGTDLRPSPWINCDIVPRWPNTLRGCDILWDATRDVIPCEDGGADEVYAGYLFLHVPPRHHSRLIADIRRALCPSGKLVVGEVDMALVMSRWLSGDDPVRCSELIWGEMGSEHGPEFEAFDRHVQGWTEEKLRAFLLTSGFRNVERIQIHSSAVWYELTLSCIK